MKKVIAVILALIFVFLVAGCGKSNEQSAEETESSFSESSGDESSSVEEEKTELEKSGIKLTDEFSFTVISQDERIEREVEFIKVSEISEEYLSIDGKYTFVDCNAPQIEYIKSYEGTNGGTIRFCTTASSVRIKVEFDDLFRIWSDYVQDRANFGIEVFEGTGTDRVDRGDPLNHYSGTNIDKLFRLDGEYNEVLITLPCGASLESLKIGFRYDDVEVGLPLERSHNPIVFYGSAITRGVSASKASNGYANLAGRMLDANVINLGFMNGAHGESEIADYIASLEEISAFVMEFDNGATLEELKDNHYNFYKKVRDAHPDIPIIIMSDLVYSEAQQEEAKERVKVIADTYNRAVKSGDQKVYFLDGGTIFPMDLGIGDLYTIDMILPSDTGMFYLATCVYDILSSAFTEDGKNSETERLPGLRDAFDFDFSESSTNVSQGEHVKISDIAEEYVESKIGSKTYLKPSLPQIEVGGINDPVNNNGEFYRLDASKKDEYATAFLSPYMKNLIDHTSGGTLRFRTNAEEIVIKVTMKNATGGGGNSVSLGNNGIEVYVGTGTAKSYALAEGQLIVSTKSVTQTVKLPGGYVEVMIGLPTYSGISSITIGINEDAEIAAPLERDMEPVLFYGSSITQGGCAKRTGLAYTNVVTRLLNADCTNLGFSASARGEQIMAEYIANKEMSVFVMDYDHNSSVEELESMHYNFYKTVREANPDLPILMLSRPIFTPEKTADDQARVDAVRATYDKAKSEGDENVYFIEGIEFFPEEIGMPDLYMIDGTHPNDLGMYYMAKTVYEAITDILKK